MHYAQHDRRSEWDDAWTTARVTADDVEWAIIITGAFLLSLLIF